VPNNSGTSEGSLSIPIPPGAVHIAHRRWHDCLIQPVNRPRLFRSAITSNADYVHGIVRHPLLRSKLSSCRNILGTVILITGHQTSIRHGRGVSWESDALCGELTEFLALACVKGVCSANFCKEVRLCGEPEKLRVHELCCSVRFTNCSCNLIQRSSTLCKIHRYSSVQRSTALENSACGLRDIPCSCC